MNYKTLAKKTALKSGAFQVAHWINRQRAVILRYHSIQDFYGEIAQAIGTGICHGQNIFKEHMEIIARYFHPVSMNDLLMFSQGKRGIPKRAVVVTFDDGFADNYEFARPILNRYGIQAAFYITVEFVDSQAAPWFCRLRHAFGTTKKDKWLDQGDGKTWSLGDEAEKRDAYLCACQRCARVVEDEQERAVRSIEEALEIKSLSHKNLLMMSWDQIRRLSEDGHIIGSHTLTHPNLAHIGQFGLNRELAESRRRLEDKLQTKISHFSYPSPILEPHWNENTQEAVKRAGYETAVTCTPGPVGLKTNPLSLNRIWVPSEKYQFLWDLEWTFLGRRT
jgi:peptidoglycan/xylan/chitin deacetylase (PgdA/CDA1 family)